SWPSSPVKQMISINQVPSVNQQQLQPLPPPKIQSHIVVQPVIHAQSPTIGNNNIAKVPGSCATQQPARPPPPMLAFKPPASTTGAGSLPPPPPVSIKPITAAIMQQQPPTIPPATAAKPYGLYKTTVPLASAFSSPSG